MSKRKESTLAALLEEKKKRGRPPRAVSRQNVYVALTQAQKRHMRRLARGLPEGISRADIPDIAVTLLAVRLEVLRRAVSGRNREVPEGITDLDSLYLLWDLPLTEENGQAKWTSVRLSPQQVIDLGRVHGVLNALFGANRSQVFGLGLALLERCLKNELADKQFSSAEELNRWIADFYL
ncbi:MAG: hypothetical protein R3300_13760 [Candidatus Promineifilaceae bacterium]|nr:hypothetical protein [Candidatus Promineifilaceae bacterium]